MPPGAIPTTVHCPGLAREMGRFHAYNLSLCPMNSPAEARARPAITPTHPHVKVKWYTMAPPEPV
ncbi:protein of unknown function [Methanoculleus bourgensis]|uniref:Uncharacterized protein n=1 Tax=Methanoculleus bourgensis TaxID=83986 RepID=A0A0X3BK94_9EURY|nr:protein of unknown function [Methanoculleus bourgensis]